ncbi:hypothetical protein QE370_000454 [Aeromicrobium sp. SORGH_AS981]|uniref:hypothetical protein n=1 Tax=Aeromicrobium sp. SORGH_AS_0981 TaxID=3041802 RepID=UPI00285FC4C9|nr:hypothetical protein [Aeromicrobium sp. SORGH_AS_0981]MDR6117270.1 hypothetical protein [Aeromicrobium sp. SORGH_AS_0981]
MAHWDTDELDRLIVDMSGAPGRIQRSAPKAFEVAANKIKKGLIADATGHGHLPQLPRYVSYDRLALLRYEIGFEKDGQGNLGNVAAIGTSNNAPVLDHRASTRRELPHLERALGDIGENAVLGEER